MLTRGFIAELRLLQGEIDAGRLAILCGAGISAPPPASLPLAAALVQRTTHRLLHPYEGWLRALTLRPEMLFSYLYRKNAPVTFDAIRDALSTGAFNRLHHFCAQVIERRGAVITTNFDTLIEAALEAGAIPFHRSTSTSRFRNAVLFKIHGSADDPASLALTIDQVGAGLDAERSRSLHKLVRGRVVLVLGYSGNDQLDIMPVLRIAGYDRIVWIVHDRASRLRRTKPPLAELRLLPRATFWRGDTSEAVEALAPSPTGAGGRASAGSPMTAAGELSDDQKRHAVAEILMHENRYREVIDFVDRYPSHGDLRLTIARFEASSSISRRPADWSAQRDGFLDALFEGPADEQIEFLPTMAKFNHRLDRLRLLRQIELRALAGDAATEQHIEAAIETLYELIYNHFLSDAKELHDAIAQALARRPNLLLRGRLLIEQAYLLSQRYALETPEPALLAEGVRACQEASFLLGPEICNDPFFFHQARSNLGWLYRLRGEFELAGAELKAARRYFHGVSFNNALTQWLLLAGLRRAEGKFAQARRLLRSFFRINRDSGRTYWLGFASREDAICAAALGAKPAGVRSLLRAAARCFEEEENQAEADLTRLIEGRVLNLAGSAPSSPFTEPVGIAWKQRQ